MSNHLVGVSRSRVGPDHVLAPAYDTVDGKAGSFNVDEVDFIHRRYSRSLITSSLDNHQRLDYVCKMRHTCLPSGINSAFSALRLSSPLLFANNRTVAVRDVV